MMAFIRVLLLVLLFADVTLVAGFGDIVHENMTPWLCLVGFILFGGFMAAMREDHPEEPTPPPAFRRSEALAMSISVIEAYQADIYVDRLERWDEQELAALSAAHATTLKNIKRTAEREGLTV